MEDESKCVEPTGDRAVGIDRKASFEKKYGSQAAAVILRLIGKIAAKARWR